MNSDPISRFQSDIALLECCDQISQQRGDYLVVGIHGDSVVNNELGMNLPLLNLHERVLSVLGCRYVSDVLIDAPYHITSDMIASLKISEVICIDSNTYPGAPRGLDARFDEVRRAGILSLLESPSEFNMGRIVQRIQQNHEAVQARIEAKMEAERSFYRGKHESNLSISTSLVNENGK